jgi:hypothetical protein
MGITVLVFLLVFIIPGIIYFTPLLFTGRQLTHPSNEAECFINHLITASQSDEVVWYNKKPRNTTWVDGKGQECEYDNRKIEIRERYYDSYDDGSGYEYQLYINGTSVNGLVRRPFREKLFDVSAQNGKRAYYRQAAKQAGF